MRPQMKINLPHLDAQMQVALGRSLEAIDPAAYFTLFAGLLGRSFVPQIEGVPAEADVYSYKKVTFTGQTDVGAPGRGATDDPVAGVQVEEVKCPIVEIPASMTWTMRELEQAAKFGTNLDTWTVQAAMSMIARRIDRMIAFGRAGTTITGLLNNSAVDTSTATTKTGGQIEWTASTPPAEMLADIALLLTEARAALNQASLSPGGDGLPAIAEWTILMPTFHYGLAGSTPRASGTDTTVLQYALTNFRPLGLVAIEEWNLCDADSAYATSGGLQYHRMVCYARNPLMIGSLVPDEWTQRNPQEEGQKIVVPARGLCGGTVFRYNVAARYMNLSD